jgi:TRAP-type mannitol/chloroaromatic compound transport system permease small subunit
MIDTFVSYQPTTQVYVLLLLAAIAAGIHAYLYDRKMTLLLRLSAAIDWINNLIGKNVSWLILVAVLISAGNATVRKAFDISSNMWLELQWYLYGTVFMLAAAYTLLKNEHIRIDVVSNTLSKKTRDFIDLFCHVFFLMPFVLILVWLCVPWFSLSFRSGEISANAGGLVIWPAKLMILLGFMLLVAQGFSEIIKRVAVIAGVIDDPTPQHHLPPDAEGALKIEGRNDA